MARYLGPKHRMCRKFGEKLCDSDKCPAIRRPYKPGVHWQKRGRISEYGTQLREKQKAKFIYGLLEKQFRTLYDKASKEAGVTGTRLLQLLETRLDNTVFRSGFAQTRYQARQLVNHGFIAVNGRKVDIPSFQVKVGDVITIRDEKKAKKYLEDVKSRLENYKAPEWLEIDKGKITGKVLTVPVEEMLEHRINPQLIVEFYSRK